MTFKTLSLSLLVLPLFTITACANSAAVTTDDNGIPQTRNNLTDDEQQQFNDFLAKQKDNMRYIKGGSYEMGDFGHKLDWTDGIPLTGDSDNKPLHQVTLDSFSMNAYKATYADFDTYSMATGQDKVSMQPIGINIRQPNAAAGINWQTAQHYCQWLGQQLDVPMSLPTEAQWEYAARNRGNYILFPTDTGEIDPGRNMWTYEEKTALSEEYNTSLVVPILGLYPSNPLGLYDLSNQNYEWMLDWYDPEYYSNSPANNPKGPQTGTEKVLRGVSAEDGSAETQQVVGEITVGRFKKEPNPPLVFDDPDINQNAFTSARCVANSNKAL